MNHANKCKLTIIKSQKMIKSESKHKCHVKLSFGNYENFTI